MCTPNVLMIDFDEGVMTKEDFIYKLKNYCSKVKDTNEYLFWIYESDRGLHAYLVNKYIQYNSKEAEDILRSLTPGNIEHINLVKLKTHCVRIGPKITQRGGYLKSKTEILKEFVEQKCYNNICQVGYGEIDQQIENILKLKMDVIDIVKNNFKNHFDDMIHPHKIQGIRWVHYRPSDKRINKIRNSIIDLVDYYGVTYADSTDFTSFRRNTLVNANRYSDLFEDENVENFCSRRAITAPNKRIGDQKIKDIRFLDNIPFLDLMAKTRDVLPIIEISCKQQIILLRGPIYPFILGFDMRMKLFYIIFYDLLMIDWDVVEGIPKTSTVKIIERYINSQNLTPYNERVTKSGLCFKMYETDNGTHAYIISHKMPFFSNKSSSVMINTCSDFTYAAFSRAYGYSIRLSPKIYNKDMSIKSGNEVTSQFVQNEGIDGTILLGNVDEIDPYLDDMTNLIYDTQKYIMKIKGLTEMLIDVDNDLLENVRSYVVNRYKSVQKTHILKDNVDWSIGNRTCRYINTGLLA